MAKTQLDKFEQALRIFEKKINKKSDMLITSSLRAMLYSITSFVSLNLKHSYDESTKILGDKSIIKKQEKAIKEAVDEFKKFSTDLKADTIREYNKKKANDKVTVDITKNELKSLELQLKDLNKNKKRKSKATTERINDLKSQITRYKKQLSKFVYNKNKDKDTHEKTLADIKLANTILADIVNFTKLESGAIKTLMTASKVSKYTKAGVNAAAIASSLALGSGLPLAIPEGIKALHKRAGEFKKESGTEKLKSIGLLGLKAAGLFGGSAGLMMVSSSLSQKRNERLQKEKNIKTEIFNFRKSLHYAKSKNKKDSSFGSPIMPAEELHKLIATLKKSGGLPSQFSAKSGGAFGVQGGKDSGKGGLIDNLRVHKGETVTVTPAKDNTIVLLKTIAERLLPLKSLAKSNDKIAGISEETLENAEDASARGGLLSKSKSILSSGSLFSSRGMSEDGEPIATPEKGGMLKNAMSSITSSIFGRLANTKFIKKIPGLGSIIKSTSREGSPVYITNWNEMPGGMGGGLSDFMDIPSRKSKGAAKGASKLTKLASKMAGKGSGLLGKGAGLLGKGAGALSKMGPLLGGLAKFAGPVGLALTAGQALHGGFKGWGDADKIAGVKKGEKASIAQKTGAAAAGALSSLSFGLVKPETMYKGLSTMAEFSPVGLLGKGFSRFFKDDKKDKTEAVKTREVNKEAMKTETAPSTAQTTSSMGSAINTSNLISKESITKTEAGLVISNVSPAGVSNVPTVKSPIISLSSEGGVNNIVNNSQGISQASEGSKLKNAETITDMRNQQKLFNSTKEAINNISINSGGGSTVSAPSIITTGDMQSYIGRLARSY